MTYKFPLQREPGPHDFFYSHKYLSLYIKQITGHMHLTESNQQYVAGKKIKRNKKEQCEWFGPQLTH